MLDIHLLMTLACAGAIALADYLEAAAVVVLFALAEHWERCSVDKVGQPAVQGQGMAGRTGWLAGWLAGCHVGWHACWLAHYTHSVLLLCTCRADAVAALPPGSCRRVMQWPQCFA